MDSQKKIGRYEVTSVMGQGAMGTVYKAVDPLIERVVAIKTINLELSRDERAEFEERFYREAKSAGRLNHPNIVTIYDVGETEEAAYIAMEYLEGESLREMLDSGVVLPIQRICSIAAQVASALDYAHENGVVHRDIKPANIMISRNRDVKLMDFGIALIPTGSRTQAGTVLGSPKYMAPEQVTGKATDGRADIFSLGAVLYEMLTGSTPFNGDNLTAIMYKILNDPPEMPSALNARVPRELDRIIAKALAKRPEDRYQTAKEFAKDLKHYEAQVSREARQQAAGGAAAMPAQKGAASPGRQSTAPADDPLDVKTEILLPPRSNHGNAAAASHAQSSANTSRKALLLALPVLALAVYAVIHLSRKPEAPAVFGKSVQQSWEKTAQAQPSEPPAKKVQTSVAASVDPANDAADDAEPSREATAPATLSLAITPWGEVSVDGKIAGVSPPLTQLKLKPGTHNIVVRNGTFEPYRVKVSAAAGQSLRIKHKFK